MFRCVRIQGLDTMEGILLLGKEHVYVVDGFTLLKTREIRDIESLPPDSYEPILPVTTAPRQPNIKRHCSKFAYDDIRWILYTNVLLIFYLLLFITNLCSVLELLISNLYCLG